MDIKAELKGKVEELVGKIKADKNLTEKFKADPVGTVEGLLGVDLPKDQVKAVADAVKAKLDLDKLGGALGGLVGKK